MSCNHQVMNRVLAGAAAVLVCALGSDAFLGPPPPPQYDFFFDQAEFEAAVAAAGKVEKGTETIPWEAAPDGVIGIADPFDTTVAVPGWIQPGVLLDNLTWQANTGGADPSVPAPHGEDGLAAATTGFGGIACNILVANFFVDSFDILSGPPAGDNHTAMSMVPITTVGGPTVNITVFDKNNVNVGTVPNVAAPISCTGFLGIIMPPDVTIGRVNIFDPDDGAEGVSEVTVYISISACAWDLNSDGSVGILDLLALLAAWGTDPGGPPDFDGDGPGAPGSASSTC